MTQCEYLRKLCKAGCDNYQCRAFFPERQPMVARRDIPMCQSVEHENCIRFKEGREYHAEKLRKKRLIHCPFASNTVCGKPWDWWCKGSTPPFELTLPVLDENKVPKRDVDGNILFTRSVEDIKETCLSGDPEIYEGCPHYKSGVESRKQWRERKNS